MDKISIELAKYGLWDNLDNLKDLFDKGPGNFDFLYNFHLRQILMAYSKFLRTEIPPYSRLVEFLLTKNLEKNISLQNSQTKSFLDYLLNV